MNFLVITRLSSATVDGGQPDLSPDTFGCVNRASLEKDPREVASMFDGVARRYDLTNTVLSLGQDAFWRRATREALRIGTGEKVLDLAAGTAVSTEELATSGAWCVAADFSVGMLAGGGGPQPAEGGGRRNAPAVRRRCLRCGDHQLRSAQRGRSLGGLARDGAGDPSGWAAGGV